SGQWRSWIREQYGRASEVTMRKLFFVTIAAGVLSAQMAFAQADAQPANSAPNPYETIKDWAKLPAGRTWGSTSAVEIDKDGKSIWVAERCGQNSCQDSMLDPMLH